MTDNQTDSGTKQAPLTTRNAFVAEIDVESLELLADAVRPLKNPVELSIGPDKLVCKGHDLANTIAAELARPVEAPCKQTIAVESGELAEAIEDMVWGEDRVALEIVDDDDGEVLEIYDSVAEDRFWHNSVDVIDATCETNVDSLIDHEFEAVAEAEAWQLAGSIRKVSDPADLVVRVRVRDGGITLEGDEMDYAGDTRRQEWSYPDHCRADVDLSPGVDDVMVPLMEALAWDAAEMIPIDGEVTVKLAEDYPVVLESTEGVTVAIAPRRTDTEGKADQ